MSLLTVIFKCSSLQGFEHGRQYKLLEASAWFHFHCRFSHRFESQIYAALTQDSTCDTTAMRWQCVDDTIHRPLTMNAIPLRRHEPCSCSVKEKYYLSTHESKLHCVSKSLTLYSAINCYLPDSILSRGFITQDNFFFPLP